MYVRATYSLAKSLPTSYVSMSSPREGPSGSGAERREAHRKKASSYTRLVWVNESSVYATITEEAEKRRQRKSATSQPAAGSHGSLFLSTSLNFHTVNILSLRARGELWRRSKLAQIR